MSEQQLPAPPIPIQATAAKAADSSWISWQQQEKQATLKRLEKLHPEYLADLTDTMSGLLHQQKGMEAFWQTVQTQPQHSYHLHLTHKDKALLNLPWQMAIDRDAYPSLYVSKGTR
ncbi:hypothetical protein [Paraflavitalea speifideaquila]|uniref:hypothetical protein n=1 Tax=Paraflavitalea speifideaquila TaxID=3076558 RepID=UPI0028E9C588|nr:hypothetical protein [Paraflavitalea speifideiaquila]